MTSAFKFLLLTFLGLIFISCAKPVERIFRNGFVKKTNKSVPGSVYKTNNFEIGYGDQSILIDYLGAGGVYIRNENSGILIDPFFSNHKFWRVALKKKIKSDTCFVDRALKKYPELGEKVKGVFVTHSHYDHLMDVPYITKKYLQPGTKIHTNTSGVNMIGDLFNGDMANLDSMEFTTFSKAGQKYPFENGTGSIDVWPIKAEHAPHFLFLRFYKGTQDGSDKLTQAVEGRKAKAWKVGATYSFLIDFKDSNNEIQYRILVQSSAAPPYCGWINAELLNRHRIDLAILGAASHGYTKKYPKALVNHLQPKNIMVCHWEDFFVPYYREEKCTVRFTGIPRFYKKLIKVYPFEWEGRERITMPNPRVTATLRY